MRLIPDQILTYRGAARYPSYSFNVTIMSQSEPSEGCSTLKHSAGMWPDSSVLMGKILFDNRSTDIGVGCRSLDECKPRQDIMQGTKFALII